MSAQSLPTTDTAPAAPGLSWTRGLLYILMGIFALFFLVPLYVGIVTSLKSMGEVTRRNIWTPPTAPTLENWGLAWEVLHTSFLNSIYLSLPVVVISSLLGSMNGYVLSKWKFRGSNLIFALILFGMFIPYQAILIPLVQFLQTRSVNGSSAYGTIPGLALVHIIYGIPITTLIFRNYYVDVPGELIESGTIDGAGFFGIYRHIVLPIQYPGLCGGADLAVYRRVERVPVRGEHHQQPGGAAGDGGAGRAGLQPGGHQLRHADGRLAADRATDAAGLYLPGPLLHSGGAGRGGERISAAPVQ